MHDVFRTNNFCPKNVPDTLVSKTDAKDRDQSAESTDHVIGNPGFPGGTRSRRNENLPRAKPANFGNRNLVISVHTGIGIQLPRY